MRTRRSLERAAAAAGLSLLAAAVVTELRKPRRRRTWHGTVAGRVPYDLRRPTLARTRRALWNPRDRRLLVPHGFGVGWSVNLARAARRLRRYS